MAQRTEEKITASKVVALISVLYLIYMAVIYFNSVYFGADALFILYGILALLFAIVIFISLDLIDLGKVKIPYWWWLLLIIGIVLVIIAYFSTGYYFPALLVLMAALLDLITQKKPWKASKLVALVGVGLGFYECIALFLFPAVVTIPIYGNNIVVGIFGLILAIVLIILIFDLVDLIVLDYSWWVVLIIGFVFFAFVSPYSTLLGYALLGYGGIVLLIAFVLMLMAY